MARELGNVAEACRQRGLDRTSFYEWKRRFQTQGFEGLKDLPPIHKSHPQTTPPEVVDRIKALALAHPAYGCNRHEAMLALEGVRVSSITIQKILNENGLGTKVERWLALEQQNAEKAIEITPEQAAFLEKLNPCFRERHVESTSPGELLSADTFFVGNLKGVGKVYLHAVVDTFGSYVNARLDARESVGAMAKVTRPSQDLVVASTTDVSVSGLTRANFARFWLVSSSRWASTQALAPSPVILPVTAESMIVFPAPVGATPNVLSRVESAARLRSTKSFWRGRRSIARPHCAQAGRPGTGDAAGCWTVVCWGAVCTGGW